MKNLFFSAAILAANVVFSQVINEQVNFDNYNSPTDNDLTQRFMLNTPNNYFTQSILGGITGGAIVPPNYLSWGNDVVKYCSTYKNNLNSLMETTISFKYNSALINPNEQERIAVIWLNGTIINHNIGFYLENNGFPQITVYNTTNYTNYQPATLISGHWYKMVTQYKSIGGIFGDQAFAKIEIFDIGISGNESPNSVGVAEADIYDVQTVNNTHYKIALAGAKWGGAEYLDNFTYSGEKFNNICEQLSSNEVSKKNRLSAFPVPTNKILNIINPDNGGNVVEIYDASGKLVANKSFSKNENKISVDVESLPKGVYTYKIGDLSSRFIKN